MDEQGRTVTAERRSPRVALFLSEERDRFVGYVRSLIRDAADMDAEDIVQDVYAKVLGIADIQRPIESLSAYIYQSIRNRVTDLFRTRKKHLSMDAEVPGTEGITLEDLMQDLRQDSSARVESRATMEFLNRAIGELSPSERDVVVATEISGLTFQELSEQTGEPIGTLLSRKSRAFGKIRAKYAEMRP